MCQIANRRLCLEFQATKQAECATTAAVSFSLEPSRPPRKLQVICGIRRIKLVSWSLVGAHVALYKCSPADRASGLNVVIALSHRLRTSSDLHFTYGADTARDHLGSGASDNPECLNDPIIIRGSKRVRSLKIYKKNDDEDHAHTSHI